MKKKYANKSPLMRFFHKYTGFIVMAIVGTVVIGAWYWYDVTDDSVFFEGWLCINIIKLSLNNFQHDNLTEHEHIRLHEISEQCFADEQFIAVEH